MSLHRAHSFGLATVVTCLSGAFVKPALAQQATTVPTLPPVTVEAPQPPKKPAQAAEKKVEPKAAPQKQRQTAARKPAPQTVPQPGAPVVAAEPPPAAASTASPYEAATGPTKGYVPSNSASATKSGTPLIETPQTVNVVTEDQMKAQGIDSVSQALRYTPGVVAEYRPTTRYDSMFIRGFGGGGNNANYVSFWDGLRVPKGISYAIPTIDPFFLSRIDIVKGPSSVLFGQISPGGFVNLVSKRPPSQSTGEIETVIGTNNYFQTGFDFGGAVTPNGNAAYRVTGLYRESDSQINYAKSERFTISPELALKLGPGTTLVLQAYYQNEPKGGFYNSLPALGSLVPYKYASLSRNFNPGEPGYDKFEREQFSAGYFLEHKFDDVFTVRQNLRYTHVDSLFQAVAPASFVTNTSILNRTATRSKEDFDALTVDNQAEAKFTTGPFKHTVLGGLDYYYRDADRWFGSATLTAANRLEVNNPVYGQNIPTPVTSLTKQSINQTGLYLQDQIKIDKFVFVLGGRQDWSHIDTSTSVTQADDQAFTWRAGVLYNFDNGLAPYASYSTSFEPTASLGIGNKALKPVTGEQTEVGIKYQPYGTNSLFTLSWFDITQSNVLVATTTSGFFSQLGEVSSKGLEAEAKIAVTPNFNVIGSYAYTDATITKDSNAAFVGKTPASVPEHMASFWVDYRFTEGSLAGLGLAGGVRYIGETYANNVNQFVISGVTVPAKIEAFTLFDAAVRYDLNYLRVPALRGWEVAVNATNLFDKDYVAGCIGSPTTSAAALTGIQTQCYYGDGRTVLGRLKYKW